MYRTSLCSRPWKCSQAQNETKLVMGKKQGVLGIMLFISKVGKPRMDKPCPSEWINRDTVLCIQISIKGCLNVLKAYALLGWGPAFDT